jgi:hypothetical protein
MNSLWILLYIISTYTYGEGDRIATASAGPFGSYKSCMAALKDLQSIEKGAHGICVRENE